MKKWILFVACGGVALAAPPNWWGDPQTGIYSGQPANNAGPVNGGQLKNVVKKAALYLDLTLPEPGAGATIHALVDSLHPAASDYSPVNLAQAKAMAKPFYQRLHDVGYNTKQNLINHGAPGWAFDVPWNPATSNSTNAAPLLIGQLKWIFSFDLTGFQIVDTDHDNIPDPWETDHGLAVGTDSANGDLDGDGGSNYVEYLRGTDPQEFWNGLPPVLTAVQRNVNGGLPSSTITPPLTVTLTNNYGKTKPGEVITFSITSATGGSLQNVSGTTDSAGQAKATLVLPATVSIPVNVRARYVRNGVNTDCNFSLAVESTMSKSPDAPGMPTVTAIDNGTKALIEWQDNSFNETGFFVYRTEDNQTWTNLTPSPNQLAANTTSYTDTGLIPGRVYIYRIAAVNPAP